MEVRSRFSKPVSVPLICKGKGRTKQAMSAECDVNLIMKKYQKTGAISHFRNNSGEYGFASGIDFHSAMNIIVKAQTMFSDLPSSIRNKFGNDPAAFLDFAQDPDNADAMAELGLIEAPEVDISIDVAPSKDVQVDDPPASEPDTVLT